MIVSKRTGNTYQNWLATPMMAEGSSMSSVMWKWIKGGERERPEGEIPIVPLTKDSFSQVPADGLLFWWLGHSTVLIEMGGSRFLIDPVFERHASPVSGFTKRFSKTPVRLEDLPAIDAVVISHDHYDHLEKHTVVALSERGSVFFVPSGVGEQLRTWGVPDGQFRELSWWVSESRTRFVVLNYYYINPVSHPVYFFSFMCGSKYIIERRRSIPHLRDIYN